MEIIKIKKSETADTRTCDVAKVSEQQLLESTLSHISDVKKGMLLFLKMITTAALNHDRTKLDEECKKIHPQFFKDFKNNFQTTDWYKMHQEEERHHISNKEYIQEDVNLIDILEQITDGVMAGLARSGKYRMEPISKDLLMLAYKNTINLLLENVEVIES